MQGELKHIFLEGPNSLQKEEIINLYWCTIGLEYPVPQCDITLGAKLIKAPKLIWFKHLWFLGQTAPCPYEGILPLHTILGKFPKLASKQSTPNQLQKNLIV